jgi:hypothetical protein
MKRYPSIRHYIPRSFFRRSVPIPPNFGLKNRVHRTHQYSTGKLMTSINEASAGFHLLDHPRSTSIQIQLTIATTSKSRSLGYCSKTPACHQTNPAYQNFPNPRPAEPPVSKDHPRPDYYSKLESKSESHSNLASRFRPLLAAASHCWEPVPHSASFLSPCPTRFHFRSRASTTSVAGFASTLPSSIPPVVPAVPFVPPGRRYHRSSQHDHCCYFRCRFRRRTPLGTTVQAAPPSASLPFVAERRHGTRSAPQFGRWERRESVGPSRSVTPQPRRSLAK